MVQVVARTAFAAGRRRRAFVPALLLVAACAGTEHAVFIPFEPPSVIPPAPMDASPAPADTGPAPGREDAGSDEDAGPIPGPDLDPRVTFDWNETLPGQGTCREGSYVGSFTCSMPAEPGASAPPTPLSGQVAFTLGELSEQQVLSITRGSLKDPIGIVFHADLLGTLRCTDDEFDAHTENGVSLIGLDTFEATLAGHFDDDALVIDGEFVMVNAAGQPCNGEFHVSAAP
jgi:hypothetical protein